METTNVKASPREGVVDAAIAVRSLTKRYGAVTAVDGLSFEVHPGRVTGFLGPNGAGKSTTLRVLLGLTDSTEDPATVLGFPYRSIHRPSRLVGAVLETQKFQFDIGAAGITCGFWRPRRV